MTSSLSFAGLRPLNAAERRWQEHGRDSARQSGSSRRWQARQSCRPVDTVAAGTRERKEEEGGLLLWAGLTFEKKKKNKRETG